MNTVVIIDESLSRAKVAVRENKSIKEIASIFASEIDAPVANANTPAVPAPLSITPEFVSALKNLPVVFGAVMPAERRELSEEEIATLFAERETLRAVLDLLKNRDVAISETIRHHIDVEAETSGIAKTAERDAAGHYILSTPQNPYRVSIVGTNQEWSSEYREGSVSIDTDLLKELADAGEIEREDYLSLTREVRVFDENKALKALSDKPERLNIIKQITKRSGAGTALFVRKAKKG